MGEVLQMGRLGETDAVFTFFLAASLLAWHAGFIAFGRHWLPWAAGYGLAALATLTKGPQAPVYFVATVTVWLAMQRRWSDLFCVPHLIGIAGYAIIVGAWLVPFAVQHDWTSVRQILLGDSTFRFRELTLLKFLDHAATYPLETIGCTSPWSLALLALLSRGVRRHIWNSSGPAKFLLVALAVTYPTCWLTPGGLSRYYLPL